MTEQPRNDAEIVLEALRLADPDDTWDPSDGVYSNAVNNARAALSRLVEAAEQARRDRRVEPREGMVEVYHWDGRYLGCMGVARWERLLRDDGPRCDVWSPVPLRDLDDLESRLRTAETALREIAGMSMQTLQWEGHLRARAALEAVTA